MEYNPNPIYAMIKIYLNLYPGITSADILADRQKHYLLYECAAAIKYKMKLWTHLPVDVLDSIQAIRNKRIGSIRDMGIDCASVDLTQTLQAKFYGPKSKVCFRSISTYYMYVDSLDIGQQGRIVAHTKEAIIDKSLNITKKKLTYEIFEESEIFKMIETVSLMDINITMNGKNGVLNAFVVDDRLTNDFNDCDIERKDDNLINIGLKPSVSLIPLVISPLIVSDSSLVCSLQPLPNLFIDPNSGFIVPMTGAITPIIDNIVNKPKNKSELYKIRDYQKECLDFIIEFISKNTLVIADNNKDDDDNDDNIDASDDNNEDNDVSEDKILRIQIACGLGKSYIISMIIDSYYKPFDINNYYLILVPTRALLHQMKNNFNSYIDIDPSIIGDGNKNIRNNVIVCTYDSMQYINNISFNIIIVDEAHHIDKNNKWRQELDKIKRNHTIFFSATLTNPDFSRDLDFGITNGYLNDYALMVPVFADKEIKGEYIGQLAELIKKYCEWTHILAYCNSLQSAWNFNIILNLSDISSVYFDGTIPAIDRMKIVDDFANFKYRVICTVNTLGEGIDIPIANTVMFVEPRNSSIDVIQIIGRILRKHNSKEMAYIILPSYNKEGEELSKFLRIISDYDYRLMKTGTDGSFSSRISILTELIDNGMGLDEQLYTEEAEMLYIEMYENINKMVINEWMEMFLLIKEYVERTGKIPGKGEKILDGWCRYQRWKFKMNILNLKYKTLLETIPKWKWNIHMDAWTERFNELKDYIKEHNGMVPSENENSLGMWCRTQKTMFKSKKMSEYRFKLLNPILLLDSGIGSVNNEIKWMIRYNELIQYIIDYSKLPKQKFGPLGEWVRTQITERTTLLLHRRDLLKKIPLLEHHFK